MNQQAKRYLLKRIDEINSAKCREIETAFETKPNYNTYGGTYQKYMEGLAGLPLKKYTDLKELIADQLNKGKHSLELRYLIDEHALANYDTKLENYNKQVDSAKRIAHKHLKELTNQVKDEVMFGSDETALQALADMESFKPGLVREE